MSSEFTEGKFATFDGKKLFYRLYKHPNPREVLVILHGHGEHTGRYVKFLNYLRNEQLSIAMFDFRGHGQSEGPHVFIKSFEEYISDVSAFFSFLSTQGIDTKKVFLFGHSLGGLVALHWVLRQPEKIKALFLSSPCLGLKLPRFLIRFNRFMRSLKPDFVYKNPVYPPYLTHNLEEVESYKKDALIQRRISSSLLDEMILSTEKLNTFERLRFSFPFYVLMSGMEKVVDGARTQQLFDNIQAPHKDLKVFDNYYHEIFNELGQEKAFEALVECIRNARKYCVGV